MSSSEPDLLGWTALHHACAVGAGAGVEAAIEAGVDANAVSVDGCSALDLAITSGEPAIVDRLLALDSVVQAERNRMYGRGSTAAKRAAERGDARVLAALAALGCRPYGSELPIMFVRALVQQQTGRDLFVVSPGTEMQFEEPIPETLGFEGSLVIEPELATLLGVEVERESGLVTRVAMDRFFVVRGPPPVQVYPASLLPVPIERVSEQIQAYFRGEAIELPELVRPFEGLCQLGCAAIVEQLAGIVAWPLSSSPEHAFVRAFRHDGITAILVAAIPDAVLNEQPVRDGVREAVRRGSLAAALPLIARGLDPNASELLLAAVASRRAESIGPLIELGADPNRILGGRSPLVDAIQRGYAATVEALLDAGADPNHATDPASIVTHPLGALSRTDVYRRAEVPAMFEALIRAGADVNSTDALGRTPLHFERYTDVMGWLVERGASVELRDHAGLTALQRKMFDSHAVARGLLRLRRGLDQRDTEGNTLVHLACFSAWPGVEIFVALRELGLDLDATNDGGLTPIARAASPYGGRADVPSNRATAIAALRSLGAV